VSSSYFRSKVLESIQIYSERFGYVVKEVEISHENSPDYCIKLDEQAILSRYEGQALILFSSSDLKEETEAIDCIDKLNLRKIPPSKIKLSISYKVPVAIWQNGKVFYFVTAAGEVMEIRDNKNLNSFILVTGSDAPEKVTDLMKFISIDKDLFAKISSASWVGNRRWNILFDNDTKVMLPEDSPEKAWNKLLSLLQTHEEFKTWKYKTLDFRIANKVYAR
jgi:cell division protein FtsQ